MDALMQAQHKASDALYKAQSEAAQGAAGATGAAGAAGAGATEPQGGGKPEGDVIDAEVVEDEKK